MWQASTASNLGDGVRLVALPLLAVTLTDDPLLIAAITALTFVRWLVVGPIAGAIVDRMDKRIPMVGVQATRGAMAALFAVTVATGTVTLWMVYAATVAIAIGETFADSAAQTVVPQLVAETQLERANGRLVGAQIVTNDIAGAPLGAALFALAAASPFVLDASSYLLAALLLRAQPSAMPASVMHRWLRHGQRRCRWATGPGLGRRERRSTLPPGPPERIVYCTVTTQRERNCSARHIRAAAPQPDRDQLALVPTARTGLLSNCTAAVAEDAQHRRLDMAPTAHTLDGHPQLHPTPEPLCGRLLD